VITVEPTAVTPAVINPAFKEVIDGIVPAATAADFQMALPITSVPAPAPTMIKALHPYSPTAPNQIAMAQGDVFTLLEGVGAWWNVQAANGTEGLVPSNYVEKVAGTVADNASSEA
jgi:hypothetical protein